MAGETEIDILHEAVYESYKAQIGKMFDVYVDNVVVGEADALEKFHIGLATLRAARDRVLSHP